MPIKLFIVDDHKVFRQGIISLIQFEDDIEVVGSAGSVTEFKANIGQYAPDLVLMDLTLRDGTGTDAVKWYFEQEQYSKVLILSMHREKEYVKKVIESGADGYLLKDAGTEQMFRAIRMVHSGENFYSHEISKVMAQQLATPGKVKKIKGGSALTRRELEVLQLIAMEKTNPEIASELFISLRTVDTHRRNLLEKVQVKNTVGLVKYALRNGLIDL